MSKQNYNPQILWTKQQDVSKWGNLTGKTSEQAKAQILKNNPGLNVIIQPENSPTTRDLRMDRVRVFVNTQGRVVSQPRIG